MKLRLPLNLAAAVLACCSAATAWSTSANLAQWIAPADPAASTSLLDGSALAASGYSYAQAFVGIRPMSGATVDAIEYLYREISSDETWESAAWGAAAAGPFDQMWDASTTGKIARLTVISPTGSTLAIGGGVTISAAGIELMNEIGMLTVGGGGTLSLDDGSTVTVADRSSLRLNRVTVGGDRKLTLNIGDGARLTIGSEGARMAGEYEFTLGAAGNSMLELFFGDSRTTNDQFVTLVNPAGLETVSYRGALYLNKNDTNTGLFNIGSATLRLNGAIVVRNGIQDTDNSIFSNDIVMEGNFRLGVYGSARARISSNMTRAAGLESFDFIKEDGGSIRLSGTIDMGNGRLTIQDGNLHLVDNAAMTLDNVSIVKGGLYLAGNAAMTLNQIKIAEIDSDRKKARILSIGDNAVLNLNGSFNPIDTPGDYGKASFVIAHWPSLGQLIMTGGTVNANNAVMFLSKDGRGTVSVTGGEMNVKGINFRHNWIDPPEIGGYRNTLYLGASVDGAWDDTADGVINIGSDGIWGINSEYPAELRLGKGTLGTLGSSWQTQTAEGNAANIRLYSREGTVIRPDAGLEITFNHPLTGDGLLVLNGEGKLILNKDSDHGGTTVRRGSLEIASAAAGGRTLAVERGPAAGASPLSVAITGTGVYTLDTGRTLSIAGDPTQGGASSVNFSGGIDFAGGTLNIGVAGLTSSTDPVLSVTGDITFTAASYFDLIGTGYILGSIQSGDTFLIARANSISGTPQFTSYYPSQGIIDDDLLYSLTVSGNELWLEFRDSLGTFQWNVAAGGDWDTTSSNWLSSQTGLPVVYDDQAKVLFADMAGTDSITVTLTETVTPISVTVDNTATDYIINGAGTLAGTGKFTKKGSGNITLANDNSSFDGVFELLEGALISQNVNALGTGQIKFEGGTLAFGLTGDVALAAIGGDQAANLAAVDGFNVTLLHSDALAPLYVKDINFSGKGSMTIGAGGVTYSGATTVMDDGTLTLTGNTFTGKLTNTGAGTLNILMNGGGTIKTFEGTIVKQGTGELKITGGDMSASTGHLIIEQGGMYMEKNNNITSDIDITLKDGTYWNVGYQNGYGGQVSGNGTLTMGAGTRLGWISGERFNMHILLNAGTDGTATIAGPQGSPVFTQEIAGTGNLKFQKNHELYNGNPFIFRDGWLNNSYVGNTLIVNIGVTYDISSSATVADNMTLNPWGASANKVTIGGGYIDRSYSTTVHFTGDAMADMNYVIENDITLESLQVKGKAYLQLFTQINNNGKLTGLVTLAGDDSSVITGSNQLELAGGLAGSQSVGINLKADTAATNRLLLTGDNSAFTGTANIANANILLNSSGTRTFGGSINAAGAALRSGSAGQIISGNLSLVNDTSSGTFIFDSSLMGAGSLLTVSGNLSIGAGTVVTIDDTSTSLQDGSYNLLTLGGALTGSFDLTQINWQDSQRPSSGTFTLAWNNNNLVLNVSGLNSQVWYGNTATPGTGDWAAGTAGWGLSGADPYVAGNAVTFSDIAGVTAQSANLTGNVAPKSVNVTLTSGTVTWTGGGAITDNGGTTLAKQGNGELIIANTAPNTYAGGTSIQGGTVTLQSAGGLGTGAVSLTGGSLKLDAAGDLLVSGNTLNLNGGGVIYASGADQDISGLIGGAGDVRITVEDANDTVDWANRSYDQINRNLVKDGAGQLDINLAAANTGTLTVNAGSLGIYLASGGSLDAGKLAGSGTVTVTSDQPVVQIRGASSSFAGSLALTSPVIYAFSDPGVLAANSHLYLDRATISAYGTLNSSLTINPGGATFGAVGGDMFAVAGVVGGTGNLTLIMGVYLAFNGNTSAYAGAITNNGNMTFGNGGTAALTSGERFVSSSSLTGSGVYAVNYANDTTLAATVGGTASLTQNGAGKLTLTADNTSTGTLTIAANTEVELQGSWAGGITGNGTLIANNSGTLDLSAITGGTTLNHVSAGTVALTSPTGYTGDINVTSGGALSLAGSGFGNKITVNNGSVTGGSLASNVHVQASGNVSLGGVSGSAINSLNTTASDITVSGINGNVSLASSSVAIGVSNIAATTGTDPNTGQTGTAIIQFQDGTSTLALDSLEVKIAQNTTLRNFLTASATRDKYAVMITNGTLSGNVASDPASAVTFDLILDQILGYRFEGVEGGNLIINGQPLNVPYTVFHDEHKRLDSPSSLDVYDYVYVEGILDIDLDNGETLVVKELTGNYTTATINTGVAGATVELNNDANTRGTNYLGNISGSADIVKTGQYGLTLGSTTSGEGGNVQTDGNLSVREGELTIVGNTAVGGQTGVTPGATLNLGGDLTTGSLDLVSGSGLNMSGGSITLTGTGSTLGDGSVVNGASSINLGANAGVDIGQNVDLGGVAVNWGNGASLSTGSDITLSGLSGGSGSLDVNDGATIHMTGGGDWKGMLGGNGGTLVKTGTNGQTIRSMGNADLNLMVREGALQLARNNNVTSTDRIEYGDIIVGTPVLARIAADGAELLLADDVYGRNLTVHANGTLSLGGNRPELSAAPATLHIANGVFHSGATVNMIIPNASGGIAATGAVTLPEAMKLNLLNNGAFDFGNPVQDLVVMKADGGYLWADGSGAGNTIANGTVFTGWNVAIEKSIGLFYGSADIYLANDGTTLMANPIQSGRNTLVDVAQSHNAMAGAHLLWDAGLQPTGSTLDNLLSCIMDRVQEANTGAASRMMAASMGSTYVSMLSATQAGLRQQQSWIRNRMTGMGLAQGYDYRGELPMYNAWIQGTGSYNKLDSRGDEAGYELNTWGGTVGFDMNVNPSLTIGAAFTASFGDLKSHCADSLDGDLDMYYVNLFAQYKHKRWTHALILTGAWGEADVTRSVIYDCGMYRGTGKSDATSYGAMYEGTYDIYLNEDHTTVLQPLVNASLNYNKIDNFEEVGAGNAGLNVSDLDATTGTISAGARLMGLVGSNVFGREAVGEIRAQIVQDLGTARSTAEMAYQANPNVTQRVRGARIGSTGIQLGAGLTVPVGEQGSIFAEGNVDLRNHGTSANGSIGYRINF